MDKLSYEAGRKSAYRQLLGECLLALGAEDAAAKQADWVQERVDTITCLRSLCTQFGDNDWEDDLYLVDIIEKHLVIEETIDRLETALKFYADVTNYAPGYNAMEVIWADEGIRARQALQILEERKKRG